MQIQAHELKERVKNALSQVVQGKETEIELLLIALASGGHILLEGVPGLAKTKLARSFAQCLGLDFKRLQFTMDMLPSDITGTSIYQWEKSTFHFIPGPIFTHVLLADEINRAPAKTQSAVLEAMQEQQVSVDGKSHKLENPFLLIATQNPLEEFGVYPLPEGELDRFLFRVKLSYPNLTEEIAMLRHDSLEEPTLKPVVEQSEILNLKKQLDAIIVHDETFRYIARLTRFTRQMAELQRGASPRAAVGLLRAARAKALFENRDFVTPDDVRWLVPFVFNHRLRLLSGEEDETLLNSLIQRIIHEVRYA